MKLSSFQAIISVLLACVFVFATQAQATAIDVPCDPAALVAAINAANGTAEADTLNLAAGCVYTFTSAADIDATLGNTALPRITTPIAINGRGATLRRDVLAPNFRLMRVESSGALSLEDLTITGGRGAGGAGVYNFGVLSLQSVVMSGNNAPLTGADGGAIYNYANAMSVIYQSTFSENSAADFGGAIFNRGDAGPGIIRITDSTFTGNTAAIGGGVSNNGGRILIVDSVLSSNTTTVGGGAIADNSGTGSLSIWNSTISGNVSANGGGIVSSGTINIVNTIVAGNRATDGGGLRVTGGTMTISNSTISGNSADTGGGIRKFGALSLYNSIVWGNSSQIQGIGTTASNNIVEGGLTGLGNLNTDPLFVSPVSHTLAPTTVGDYHIQLTSPAVDQGSNTALPLDSDDLDGDEDTTEMLPIDWDGDARIFNATVDIGADEVNVCPLYVSPYTVPAADSKKFATAIRCANVDADTNTIHLTAGNYTFSTATDSDAVLGKTALPHVTSPIVIHGAGATIQRSHPTNKFRLFRVAATGSLTLEGVTLTGGTEEKGGAIYNAGILTITASTLSGNNAALIHNVGPDLGGGGIYNAVDAVLNVTDTTFSANSTLYPGGAIFNAGSSTVTDSTFTDNFSSSSGGGAIANVSNLIVGSSSFTNNQAQGAGAILTSAGSTTTVTDSHFTGNRATGMHGGAFGGGYVFGPLFTLTIADSTFTGNSAEQRGGTISAIGAKVTLTGSEVTGSSADMGGGIYIESSTVTISDTHITENQATFGGGVFSYSTLTMVNVLVADNAATNSGGIKDGGTLTLMNTTVVNNSAEPSSYSAGGIETGPYQALTVRNSIVWGNGQENIGGYQGGTEHPTVTNSLVEGGFTGAGNLDADPRFVGAGDYRLAADSPAINAGDNDVIPTGTNTDLEGNPRIVNSIVDIGAYEYQGSTEPISVDLMFNGGFETNEDGNSVPDGWTIARQSRDKLVCNPDKAYAGNCAFKFKGGLLENAALMQTVNLSGVAVDAGDRLDLAGYFKGNNPTAKAKLILSVTYSGNPIPVKTIQRVWQNATYTLISLPPVEITGPVAAIALTIKHKSTGGALWIDDVRLIHTSTVSRHSEILPAPQAPEGFRGNN